MYKRILVPLDGSELAEVALPYAEELAGRLDSEVTIIHVHEVAINASDRITQFYVQKMVDATKQGVKQYSVRMGEGSDIPVKSEIILGNPAEKILEYAEKDSLPETREKGILNKILIPLDGSRNAEIVIPYRLCGSNPSRSGSYVNTRTIRRSPLGVWQRCGKDSAGGEYTCAHMAAPIELQKK